MSLGDKEFPWSNSDKKAQIATASPFIGIPMVDFFNLKQLLAEFQEGVFTINNLMYYEKHCEDLDLPDLKISIEGLTFAIPSKFWLKEVPAMKGHPTCQI